MAVQRQGSPELSTISQSKIGGSLVRGQVTLKAGWETVQIWEHIHFWEENNSPLCSFKKFPVLGLKSRSTGMLGKGSATEIHCSPICLLCTKFKRSVSQFVTIVLFLVHVSVSNSSNTLP